MCSHAFVDKGLRILGPEALNPKRESHGHCVRTVVDKYGFLWTGSGSFQYSSTSGTYSVLRFDTGITSLNDPAMTIFAVQMTDMANVRL